jgi:hypothetical protein
VVGGLDAGQQREEDADPAGVEEDGGAQQPEGRVSPAALDCPFLVIPPS